MFDPRDPDRQQQANRLIEQLSNDDLFVTSSQVVQEFLNAVTRKFADRMSPEEAYAYIHEFLWPYCEVFPSLTLYDQALAIHQTTQYGFYDSLIVAAAIEAECKYLVSEDLQSGRVLGDLEIVNPFA